MTNLLRSASVAGAIFLLAALPACKRADEAPRPTDNAVHDDMKALGKATEKAANDLGHATVEAAGKVGAGGQDAWITTKVKSALASEGLDPLRVHVDTDAKLVTLSGTVDSAAEREKAVALARGVKDVAGVTDHLFVGPARK
jgi:osmotically-inducible protein OsmY